MAECAKPRMLLASCSTHSRPAQLSLLGLGPRIGMSGWVLPPWLRDLGPRQDPEALGEGHWTKKSFWKDQQSSPCPCGGTPRPPGSSLSAAFRKPQRSC